ncbi:MAG: tRNA lysidine(34) synthetase TilS, partial [Oscillospiraceae bacterium]|nr:tRNA lysidine(34) synthetase TilS [Oscillospiraceae bacterium]
GTGGMARLDLPGGLQASREFDLLRLRRGRELPEPYDILLEPGVWQTIPATGQRVCRVSAGDAANVYEKFQIFRFKNSNICGSIHVRSRKIGDTLRIAGRNGEKTLKKWMIEERIPALERDSWPVFADDLGVVAVPGLGTAERAAAGAGEADGAILLSERNEPCRK